MGINSPVATEYSSREFLLGLYAEEEKLMAGARKLRSEGFQIHDVFTPYPVHGLDEAMGLRRSRLALVTFFVGFTAMSAALLLQFWTSAVDWNINVGGKPENSLLAFLPVTFELTVLFGGLATAAAFFWRCGLFPGAKPPLAEISQDRRITDHLFIVALERRDASFRDAAARRVFSETGTVEILERSVVT